jgi:1,4-dihydroxy-2-naphthoate octaprenyltransferase
MATDAIKQQGASLAIKDWLALARIPFHLVGVFPFVLGTVVAVRSGAALQVDLLAAGLVVVVCVMLATYFLGEHFDFEGDRLSAQMERNRFSGGTQVLQAGRLARRAVVWAAAAAIVLALAAGAYVVISSRQWVLLPMGLFGLAAGATYSLPPIRTVARGIGEVLIGICYGLLPVSVGFLLQAKHLPWSVCLISLPVSLAVFNVILLNEFPDHPADCRVGKKNLVVRFDRQGAAWIYAAACWGMSVSVLGLIWAYSPGGAAAWAVASVLAAWAFALGAAVLAGAWRNRPALEVMCGLTIALNLAIPVALMFLCRVGGH